VRGTVVVTGASTGIGEASARQLSRLGFDVVAGVRSEEAAARAREAGLEPVRLDVTDAESVAAAATFVEARVGDRGLDGLVNNAGVAVSGPVELVPLDEWRRQLEVNLIGQVAVTQTLLPALLRRRGRVVMVSSIGGRVAAPLFGPYSASKFGLEAVSDALRREVAELGVRVVVVEPGAIATPIWERGIAAADALWDAMPPLAHARYGPLVATLRGQAEQAAVNGEPPEAVARIVVSALTAPTPRTRYVIGRDARIQALLARALPARAMDALLAAVLKARS
jgi:NAD(P)-dependent dehydrogenase (short-subunit alcohol dehydrogenase family)